MLSQILGKKSKFHCSCRKYILLITVQPVLKPMGEDIHHRSPYCLVFISKWLNVIVSDSFLPNWCVKCIVADSCVEYWQTGPSQPQWPSTPFKVATSLGVAESLCLKGLTRLVLKLGKTRSKPWLLMPWFLVSPGHQQPWCWICRINGSLSSFRMGSTCYLRYLSEI